MRRGWRRLPALALVAVLQGVPSGAAEPGCEALALFDAGCASCHEAQCSGRLTFGDPFHARSHVERHAGPLGDERVAELIELLLVTKETCRLDTTAAARCGGPPWSAARLRRVRVPDRSAWFVPLGTPAAGPQRLVLRFDRDTTATVRVSTAGFEVLLEASRRTRQGALELAFAAPEGETLFAQVQSAAAAELLALRVLAGPAPR